MDATTARMQMEEFLARLLDGEEIVTGTRQNRLNETVTTTYVRFHDGFWSMGLYDCGCRGIEKTKGCDCMVFKRPEFLIEEHPSSRNAVMEELWSYITNLDNGHEFWIEPEREKDMAWLTGVVNGVKPLPLPSLTDDTTAQAVV